MAGSRVTITSRLPAIARAAERDAERVVEHSARKIADGARGRAPRATGALAETIDVERILAGRWAVVAGMPWRQQEFGTVHAGAQPFMVPAAEAERDNLIRAMGGLYS